MTSPCLPLALLAAMMMPACAANVVQLQPTPNVLLARSTQTLALHIAPEIQESFANPVDRGPPALQTLNVSQWRETLTNGFHSSIGRYFVPATNTGDLTLVVELAVPTLVALPEGTFNAQVRFQAELVAADRRIVKTWSDTVTSRRIGIEHDASDLVRSAVEAMYEEIANGFPVQRD
jgi:hypothetical protein